MFLVLQYYTGPISEKKHPGIENFVEKCLFEKKEKEKKNHYFLSLNCLSKSTYD